MPTSDDIDVPASHTMAVAGRPGWRMVASLTEVPLVRAARAGDAAQVARLLAAGADPRIIDGLGNDALFEVTTPDAARALIAAGLDPAARNARGVTALEDAIGWNDLARAGALLAAGADPNARTRSGVPLFLVAVGALDRDVAMLRLLVTHGADPHALGPGGGNAFHYALDVSGAANRPDSVTGVLEYLFELGVDVRHRNGQGFLPSASTDVEAAVLSRLLVRFGL